MAHVCNKCEKEFKYLSQLKRHQENKKDCSKKLPRNDAKSLGSKVDQDINQGHEENHEQLNDLHITDSNINKLNEITKMLKDIPTINKQNANEIISLIKKNMGDNSNSNRKHVCLGCGHKFYDRQGLYKHKKYNRCNGNKQLPQNINNNPEQQPAAAAINHIDNVVNITNNIINDNRTINNNYIININPFKCESLDHITLDDFKTIYETIKGIDAKLFHFIYEKNKQNINFYKDNINNNTLAYIDHHMEIQYIHEKQFINELISGLNKSKIQLFHIFKNNLTADELVNYLKNMINYHKLYDNDGQIQQRLIKYIKTILISVYRNKYNNDIIKNLAKELEKDPELKQLLYQQHKQIIQKKSLAIKEYNNRPIDNTDDKNLYLLFDRAKSEILNANQA